MWAFGRKNKKEDKKKINVGIRWFLLRDSYVDVYQIRDWIKIF